MTQTERGKGRERETSAARPSSFSLRTEQGERICSIAEQRRRKGLNGLLRRIEKQVTLLFQAGTLMGFYKARTVFDRDQGGFSGDGHRH